MDVLVIGKPGRDAIDAAERAERRIGLPVQATVRTRTQWEAKRESFIKETPARRLVIVLETRCARPSRPMVAYDARVSADKVWTADEIERMAPDERYRLFNERVVTDLSTLPPDFVAKVRAKGRAHLAERGIIHPES